MHVATLLLRPSPPSAKPLSTLKAGGLAERLRSGLQIQCDALISRQNMLPEIPDIPRTKRESCHGYFLRP